MKVPYDIECPKWATDALKDFYIRFERIINFYQESLMMYRLVEGSEAPNNISSKKETLITKQFELPPMEIVNRNKGVLKFYPIQLFYNSIINIVSGYEQYLKEIATELFIWNEELLETNEKQLTTSEILDYHDMDDLKEDLTERAVTKLMMSSYPNLVSKFERYFHTGIHDKSSPISLFEMHHLIEVRNIIVHNDGHHTSLFEDRLKQYESKSPLGLDGAYSSPKINFDYINTFKDKVLLLTQHIDKQIISKWATSLSNED